MNSDYLKACGAAYLRYKRRCPVLAFERGMGHWDKPDILAITPGRQLIEVEVKISLSDFRADAGKRKWDWKWEAYCKNIRQHYFLVSPEIQEAVEAELPERSGLLVLGNKIKFGLHQVWVQKPAPAIQGARRLTVKEIVVMVRNQSGTLCGMIRQLAKTE